MKSLFEKEEKETALRQLKIDLISRFYPFAKDEVIKYKSVLNFDRYHLMNNELVEWDNDLIESIKEKIDWSALWKIKKISLDVIFFRKHEASIDFPSIRYTNSIVWSEELLNEFGDKFDWSEWLITKEPLSTVANLRRFNYKLNWSYVSERINIPFTDEVMEEFKDRWDWEKLSKNKNLPFSVEFVQKYIRKIDFDAASENPACLPLIYQYPRFKKWNWNKVVMNPAVVYSKETFKLIYSYYRKQFEEKEKLHRIFKESTFRTFLARVFFFQLNDGRYFLREPFIKYLPWERLSLNCRIKLDFDFIEKYKEKINFKQAQFTSMHRDVITTEFISQNPTLFDSEHYSFYYLPLTTDLLEQFEKITWNNLSSCQKLNWSWEFIEHHYDRLNFFRLSENRGVYTTLIEPMLKSEIFSVLDHQVALSRK